MQPNGYEAYNLIINGPVKDIKWSSIWGTYEGSLTQNMNSLKDFLIGVGYELDWLERPEGHSWGLWRATIDKMLIYFFPGSSTEIIAEDFAPKDFILYQNYPNPFNPSTMIKFRIADFGFVTLKIYDLLGNEVANLVNEEKSAGVYEVTFDASNLASGVYFYRLKTQDFITSKKLLLLK